MKVSVIIPCYNGEAFIADAISSVLRQSYQDIECIVVDDASKDRSREIILRIQAEDQRVVPILLDRNGGPAAARNKAIEQSTGTWITLLDADDLYEPDRVAVLVELAQSMNADIIVDNQSVRNFGETTHLFDAFNFLPKDKVAEISQEIFFQESIPVAFMNSGYLKPLFRKSFLVENRLKYDESHFVGEDFLLYAEAVTLRPRFFGTGYSGYIYFRRPASLTRSDKSSLGELAAMSDHLIGRFGDRLSKLSIDILKKRKRIILQHIKWKRVKGELAKKNYSSALALVARNPSLVLMARNFVRRRLQERPR